MWEWINETILKSEKCFSRKASFRWFVVIVIGLMVRAEHIGVSSIIRELSISPKIYESMLHFFRASSWKLEEIRREWMRIVKNSGVLFREIGVLIGNSKQLFCVPVSMTIQDGNTYIEKWQKSDATEDSHVVKIIREACYVASIFTHSILLLDRYFLTVPALLSWLEAEKQFGSSLLTIVTKAKSNAVAYEKPVQKSGRGKPAKKGKSIKLSTLFNESSQFTQADVFMYGKMESVQFLCRDLLSGKGLYHELRFVLVK